MKLSKYLEPLIIQSLVIDLLNVENTDISLLTNQQIELKSIQLQHKNLETEELFFH